jgi:two-component system sensor histidine kinase TtrS
MLLLPLRAAAAPVEYRIGVLANRGPEECLKRWQPTAQALTRRVRGAVFRIVPLPYDGIDAAIAHRQVDFCIVNPAEYVRLELRYGAQRIATLQNLILGKPLIVYGTAVVTRAARTEIAGFRDLRGLRVMAPDKGSFGGWLMAERELLDAGVAPRQLKSLEFGGIQDAPVYAVRDGRADAGIVRSDLLENLAHEGKIDLEDYRVLPAPKGDPRVPSRMPFLHSTRLYPEWPFAKLAHTPEEITDKVLIALLEIVPGEAAAKAGRYYGWTAPLNYEPVHDCLRELRYPPYEDYGKVTLRDALRAYWPQLLAFLLAAAALAAFALRLRRLNARLRLALSEVRTLSGLLPICAACKRIRDDKGYWKQIESYIRTRTDAEFTHSICPECAQKLYPDLQDDPPKTT